MNRPRRLSSGVHLVVTFLQCVVASMSREDACPSYDIPAVHSSNVATLLSTHVADSRKMQVRSLECTFYKF